MTAPKDVSPVNATLDADKRALRERLRQRRRALGEPEIRSASSRVCTHLQSLQPWVSSRQLAGYVAIEGEIDPEPALAAARVDGRIVGYPRTTQLAPRLRFCRVMQPAQELLPGRFGIAEPGPACPELPATDFDLVLVPGLGFDRHGGRLGFGGGYYDELITWLARQGRGRPWLVGLGHAFQILTEVPTGADDAQLDLIVTEDEVITCRPDRPSP